jgi:hypothetical protein
MKTNLYSKISWKNLMCFYTMLVCQVDDQGFFSRLGKNTGRQRKIRFLEIPEIPPKTGKYRPRFVKRSSKLVQDLSIFFKI